MRMWVAGAYSAKRKSKIGLSCCHNDLAHVGLCVRLAAIGHSCRKYLVRTFCVSRHESGGCTIVMSFVAHQHIYPSA